MTLKGHSSICAENKCVDVYFYLSCANHALSRLWNNANGATRFKWGN